MEVTIVLVVVEEGRGTGSKVRLPVSRSLRLGSGATGSGQTP